MASGKRVKASDIEVPAAVKWLDWHLGEKQRQRKLDEARRVEYAKQQLERERQAAWARGQRTTLERMYVHPKRTRQPAIAPAPPRVIEGVVINR